MEHARKTNKVTTWRTEASVLHAVSTGHVSLKEENCCSDLYSQLTIVGAAASSQIASTPV